MKNLHKCSYLPRNIHLETLKMTKFFLNTSKLIQKSYIHLEMKEDNTRIMWTM